jgi:hypothetical protein
MQVLEGLSQMRLLVVQAAAWPASGATGDRLLEFDHLMTPRCKRYPSFWPLRFWPFRC